MKSPLARLALKAPSLAVLLFIAAGTVSYAALGADAGNSGGQPAIPAGASLSSWHENGDKGRYLLQLVDANNRLPPVGERIVAKVLSDTNCTPDAAGLSHCRNDLALANGARITVVNNHQMARNGCLRPGGLLSLERMDGQWLSAEILNI